MKVTLLHETYILNIRQRQIERSKIKLSLEFKGVVANLKRATSRGFGCVQVSSVQNSSPSTFTPIHVQNVPAEF